MIHCEGTPLSKRGKKKTPQPFVSDEDLINDAIQANINLSRPPIPPLTKLLYSLMDYKPMNPNNFESYLEAIDVSLYLPCLHAALVYAEAMFEGLHIETLEWSENPEIIRIAISELINSNVLEYSDGPLAPIDVAEIVFDTLKEHSVIYKSHWYLLKIGLKNLIRYQVPHPDFFELITSVFLDINHQDATHDSLLDMMGVLNSMVVTKRLSIKHKLMTEYKQIRDDPTLPYYIVASKLDHIALKMRKDLNDEGSIMEDDIVTIKFFNFFVPLIEGSQFYKDLMASRQYTLPVISIHGESTHDTMLRLQEEYESRSKTIFFMDTIRRWEVNDTALPIYTIIYDAFQDIELTTKYVHDYISTIMTEFAQDFLLYIEKEAPPLFTANSVMYKPRKSLFPKLVSVVRDTNVSNYKNSFIETTIDPNFNRTTLLGWHTVVPIYPERRAVVNDFMDMPFDSKKQSILDNLMKSFSADNIDEIKWKTVRIAINKLGGFVESVAVDCYLIWLPIDGSIPIRFNIPPDGGKLGYRAYILQAMFKKWGLI